MKVKFLHLSGLVLLLSLTSCSTPKSEQRFYRLDPKTWPSNTVVLDDIIKDVRVVPLETHPDALISYLYAIRFSKDNMYMGEEDKILCFSRDGKFIRRIGNKGKGPGEFYSASSRSILVNETKSEFLLHDVNRRKFLYYSLDGKFLRETKIKVMSNTVEMITPDLLALHSGRMGGNADNYELMFSDWNGNILGRYYPFAKPLWGDGCRGFAEADQEGSCLYHKIMDYNIYQIFPDHIDTLMTLDFGTSNIDTAKYFGPGEYFVSRDEPDKVQGFRSVSNTGDHLAAIISMGFNARGLWLLDWKTGNQTFLPADSTEYMGTYLGLPIRIPAQASESWFIAMANGIDWFTAISNLAESEKADLRKKVPGFGAAEKGDENANPVLVFFRFERI
ncbi:MAG: hypothetical protein A2X22_11980 [Bacteroidetes bacterium GWF2_49_14]|nr:MAG: hypothetical protein A2X22_11980 [Bacteroidetes bacterium GWF2_49_14]HBB92106.1 hypothetical protein [Bacteroidales bacterium]